MTEESTTHTNEELAPLLEEYQRLADLEGRVLSLMLNNGQITNQQYIDALNDTKEKP